MRIINCARELLRKVQNKVPVVESGIVSREPIIYCHNLVVTPIVIRIDGQQLGYVTKVLEHKGDYMKLAREVPKPQGRGYMKIVQQIICKRGYDGGRN